MLASSSNYELSSRNSYYTWDSERAERPSKWSFAVGGLLICTAAVYLLLPPVEQNALLVESPALARPVAISTPQLHQALPTTRYPSSLYSNFQGSDGPELRLPGFPSSATSLPTWAGLALGAACALMPLAVLSSIYRLVLNAQGKGMPAGPYAASMLAVEGSVAGDDGDYVFAALLSEIPKGTRKLVSLRGANILIFWYRNELFAIENRSPAEGAFNQGFDQARFTQDFGILCPSTETEFNMKTGAVVKWLPNNSVLRFLTPPCQPLEVFPVKVDGDEIKVKVAAEERSYFDGGAKSSFERNNVFGIEPRMYLEDGTYIDEEGTTRKTAVNPSTIVITTIAVAIIAVAGTATCLYFESIPALAAFWLVGFAIVAKVVLDYSDANSGEGSS